LELGGAKTSSISRFKDTRIPFLGYLICHPKEYFGVRAKRILRKTGIVWLRMDIKRVVSRLADAGYCKKDGTPIPNFKRHMEDPQSLTNLRMRALLLGIGNYYKLANNFKKGISFISFMLRHSTAKLYAAKYKLKTRNAVFRKAGDKLARPLKREKDKRNTVVCTDEMLQATIKPKGEGKAKVKIVPLPYSKYRRTDVQTYRRTDVQTYRRTDVQTYRRTDVQ